MICGVICRRIVNHGDLELIRDCAGGQRGETLAQKCAGIPVDDYYVEGSIHSFGSGLVVASTSKLANWGPHVLSENSRSTLERPARPI